MWSISKTKATHQIRDAAGNMHFDGVNRYEEVNIFSVRGQVIRKRENSGNALLKQGKTRGMSCLHPGTRSPSSGASKHFQLGEKETWMHWGRSYYRWKTPGEDQRQKRMEWQSPRENFKLQNTKENYRHEKWGYPTLPRGRIWRRGWNSSPWPTV